MPFDTFKRQKNELWTVFGCPFYVNLFVRLLGHRKKAIGYYFLNNEFWSNTTTTKSFQESFQGMGQRIK
jgi:hypothetical protein